MITVHGNKWNVADWRDLGEISLFLKEFQFSSRMKQKMCFSNLKDANLSAPTFSRFGNLIKCYMCSEDGVYQTIGLITSWTFFFFWSLLDSRNEGGVELGTLLKTTHGPVILIPFQLGYKCKKRKEKRMSLRPFKKCCLIKKTLLYTCFTLTENNMWTLHLYLRGEWWFLNYPRLAIPFRPVAVFTRTPILSMAFNGI